MILFNKTILYTGCLLMGIWPIYQLFSYGRNYFASATPFDIIIFVLMLPLGLIIVRLNRKNPLYLILWGVSGLTICGYIALYIVPLNQYVSEAPTIIIFNGIESEKGIMIWIFSFLFSLLLMSGLFQYWSSRRV